MQNEPICAGDATQQSEISTALLILDQRITEQAEVVGELLGRLITVLRPGDSKGKEVPTTEKLLPDLPMSDIEHSLVAYSARLGYTIKDVRSTLSRLSL